MPAASTTAIAAGAPMSSAVPMPRDGRGDGWLSLRLAARDGAAGDPGGNAWRAQRFGGCDTCGRDGGRDAWLPECLS
jgi:hypothetical protein